MVKVKVTARSDKHSGGILSPISTDMYEVPDAVPTIHAVSSHVATDKDPSK